MENSINTCMELLEIIKQQEDMIAKQYKIIARLANENAELENMLNALTDEYCEP